MQKANWHLTYLLESAGISGNISRYMENILNEEIFILLEILTENKTRTVKLSHDRMLEENLNKEYKCLILTFILYVIPFAN